jgi:mRNA-degrading endonuclease RelE of RelBE toxin-antitoxin system
MRKYSLEYTKIARLRLRHLPPLIKPVIKTLIEDLMTNPYRGKALHDEFLGFYRAQHQRWRVIYSVNKVERHITIHLIAHRASVYDILKSMAPLEVHERRAAFYGKLQSKSF